MLRRFKAFQAPANIEFRDPDTGRKFKAKTRQELIKDIIAYRDQNQLEPIEELNHVLENYLCGLPENCNKCQPNEELKRSFYTYVKGGIALLKDMAFSAYVDKDVADQRAAQCVSCPNNIFPDKSGFLKWSDEIAMYSVGEKKSTYHEQLGNCKVCSCVLKSKVFHGGKLPKFPADQLIELKKVNCWQLKLSNQ